MFCKALAQEVRTSYCSPGWGWCCCLWGLLHHHKNPELPLLISKNVPWSEDIKGRTSECFLVIGNNPYSRGHTEPTGRLFGAWAGHCVKFKASRASRPGGWVGLRVHPLRSPTGPRCPRSKWVHSQERRCSSYLCMDPLQSGVKMTASQEAPHSSQAPWVGWGPSEVPV